MIFHLRMLLFVPTVWAGVTGSSEFLPEDERYSGIGQMRVSSACTASKIVPRGAVPDDAPAYVLSAGHCHLSSIGTNELVMDRTLQSGTFKFRPLIDTPGE